VDDAVKGDLGFEYVGANFALKTEMDIEASNVNSSATMAYEGVNAGGMLRLVSCTCSCILLLTPSLKSQLH
jgi:hypothetical protein